MMYESVVRGGLWASFYLMILEREGGGCFGAIPHPILGVAYGLLLLCGMYYANRGNGVERYAPELSSVPRVAHPPVMHRWEGGGV